MNKLKERTSDRLKIKSENLVTLLIAITSPCNAYADMVWPALVFADRLALVAIPIGLAIEWYIIKKAISCSTLKAFLVTLGMNTVSATIGAILIAVVGLIWEVSGGILVYAHTDFATFNPFTWIFTVLSAISITTYIEFCFIRIALKTKGVSNLIKSLTIANTITVTLTFISILMFPKTF